MRRTHVFLVGLMLVQTLEWPKVSAVRAQANAPALATAEGLRAERPATGVTPKVIEDGFSQNTAVGFQALASNTTGRNNTASGAYALWLNTAGFYNTADGNGALAANTTGSLNTATGANALFLNTTGYRNTASGTVALQSNTTGSFGTASGAGALTNNTSGTNNVAIGAEALNNNTVGNDNTATGTSALFNSTASFNTAHGTTALYNTTTGGSNVAVGDRAGLNNTTGSYNIYLGAGVHGTAADTNTMRLGLPYGGGSGQSRTFIAGIHGTQLTGSYLQVVVDANGQLGTITPPVQLTGSGTATPLSVLQQQVQAQQAFIAAQQTTIADLAARLARLEAARRK